MAILFESWASSDHVAVITVSYEHHGVSNHRQVHCLLNSFPRLTTKKTSKLLITDPLGRVKSSGFLSQRPSNAESVYAMTYATTPPPPDFLQKGPVMRKTFLRPDVIMSCRRVDPGVKRPARGSGDGGLHNVNTLGKQPGRASNFQGSFLLRIIHVKIYIH